MRRAPIVLTATVLGTAGVLLFKPLSPSALASAPTSDAAESSSTDSSGTASSGTSSSATTPSTGSTTSATAKDGTYTGDPKTTRFGTTEVSVTISGGRITEVKTLELNQADPRSYQISVDAAPTLRTEVLANQTAAVDTVSGATYTSDAYEASLQSALDKAGYTAPDGSTASTDVSSIQESGGGH